MKKNGRTWIYPFIVMGLFLLLLSNCSKDDIPDNKARTVTDIDGNVYNTVFIGEQEWMVENLKTTKYRNGDNIPTATNATWGELKIGMQCNYYNNAANCDKFGKLYNWYAVNDSRNIAPVGWHIPTDAEWIEMQEFVRLYLVDSSGSLTKALAAKTDWAISICEGGAGNDLTKNNASGFSALPGGCRDGSYGIRSFNGFGYVGVWWTSNYHNTHFTICRQIGHDASLVSSDIRNKEYGFSVRCVKDKEL